MQGLRWRQEEVIHQQKKTNDMTEQTSKKPTKYEEAMDIIGNVREKSDSIILMLSLGKDSIVCLDLCYPKFKRIVCCFMYFVKDLEHIQRWINWCKARYPRIEFVQVPHWTLSYVLRSGLYSVPQPNVKLMSLQHVIKSLRLQYDIHYVCLGMKKADGLNRNVMLKTYAADHYEHKGLFYPLATWTQKEILSYMKQRRLPEPVRYSLAASSGIGMNKECFLWLRENCPQDLDRIFATFPFAERILFEYDRKAELEEQRKQQEALAAEEENSINE